MNQDVEARLRHERDLLAYALADILMAAGTLRPEANIVGSMLIYEGAKYAEEIRSK